MNRQKDHLRTHDFLPACGKNKGIRLPRTVDFVDFSDSIRLGFACRKCEPLWHAEKAMREERVAENLAAKDIHLNTGIVI